MQKSEYIQDDQLQLGQAKYVFGYGAPVPDKALQDIKEIAFQKPTTLSQHERDFITEFFDHDFSEHENWKKCVDKINSKIYISVES